jgi:hypothetical protein
MMSNHWSEENFLDRLYGVGPEDSHLEECEQCRRRWLELLTRRGEVLAPAAVPEEFLAAQRREVYRRLETETGHGWGSRFAPALAAVSVVVLGLLLSRPTPKPQPTLAVSDSQFFSEIYSMVNSSEPEVVAPIHGLFED